MADKKLLAEWFWLDRYDGSSAALMSMECQGLYRSMLSAAWRRGARLPNDHEAVQRAIRCTRKEWARCWPKVERYWRVDGTDLVNDTQLEVYAEALKAAEGAGARARAGAEARWAAKRARDEAAAQARAQADAQAHARASRTQSPPSPSPSPRTTNPPDPPARAGGPASGNGHHVLTKGEQDATVRRLTAYWRCLARSDPRAPGGLVKSPATTPPDANVRRWQRALRTGRLDEADVRASIAHRVREDLMKRGIPVWEIEPWPPEEAERRPE